MVVTASSHLLWYFSSLRSLRAWWNINHESLLTLFSCRKVGRLEDSEEAAHLPASGVGLHHGGGALDLLVFCLLLKEYRKCDGQKLKWLCYNMITF